MEYCKNCIEGMKELETNSIDAIITDPPYGIFGLKKKLKSTVRTSNRNPVFYAEWDHFDDLDSYKQFIELVLKEFKRILKPKGQVYMFFGSAHIHWLRQMIEDYGFVFYKYLIWFKPNTTCLFPGQYGYNHEFILWFRNDEKGGNVIKHIRTGDKDVFMVNSTGIRYREECGFHPCPKPIQIIDKFVRYCTDPGDTVLDPFMGSGTTGVACKKNDRKFIGFETNPEYFEFAVKRIKREAKKGTLF